MDFLSSALTGSWNGGTKTTRISKYSSSVTTSCWENTRLEFEITKDQRDVMVIKGWGDTVWKSRRIPFTIEGVGLITSPTRIDLSITKRHKGMKREVNYEDLVLNPMTRTIEGGDDKTTVRLAHVSSSLLKDLSSHEWNGFSCVRKNRTQWAGTCMSFSLNASDDPWTCCVNGSGTSLYGFRRNRKGIKALTFKIRGSLNLQSGMISLEKQHARGKAVRYEGILNPYSLAIQGHGSTSSQLLLLATGSLGTNPAKKCLKASQSCMVCLEEDLDMSEMYTLRCPSNHQFCVSCLGADLKIRNEGSGDIAKCLGHQCEYPISTREVWDIMQRCLDEESDSSHRIVSRHVESLIKARLASLSNDSLSSPCPAPDCLGWQVSKTHTKFQRSRLSCHFCSFTYCSSCRAPFHYNCGCKQVLRVAQRWAEWLRKDRERYLSDVGVEARRKVMELESRAKQVREDEAYLAKTCRLCPKCSRRVEKLGGCDSMVCGRDWHGGNDQQGCGAHFKWSEAKPYIAAVSERYQQIKRPPAIEIQDTPHFTHKDGKQVPWLCTVCREHIHGLVFQCVHCFDLALCLTCMETSSLSSKIPANHDPKHHVFNIRVPRMNPNLVDALCGSFEGYSTSQDGDSAEWEDTRLEFYLRLPPAALRDITILPSVEAKYGSRLRIFQSCGICPVTKQREIRISNTSTRVRQHLHMLCDKLGLLHRSHGSLKNGRELLIRCKESIPAAERVLFQGSSNFEGPKELRCLISFGPSPVPSLNVYNTHECFDIGQQFGSCDGVRDAQSVIFSDKGDRLRWGWKVRNSLARDRSRRWKSAIRVCSKDESWHDRTLTHITSNNYWTLQGLPSGRYHIVCTLGDPSFDSFPCLVVDVVKQSGIVEGNYILTRGEMIKAGQTIRAGLSMALKPGECIRLRSNSDPTLGKRNAVKIKSIEIVRVPNTAVIRGRGYVRIQGKRVQYEFGGELNLDSKIPQILFKCDTEGEGDDREIFRGTLDPVALRFRAVSDRGTVITLEKFDTTLDI